MNATALLREIMENKGMTCTVLAQKLGYSVPSYVTNRLARSNGMRIDNFLEMIEAMDCEVIIKNKIGKKETWALTSEPKE